MAGAVAVRYVPLTVVTPAGTAIASPQVTAVDVANEVLIEVHVIVPAGHSGLTGLQVTVSGRPLLPWSTGPSWIKGDGLSKVYEVGYEVGSLLNVVTYNLDVFAHQHELLFKVTDPALPLPAPVQLVDITPAAT